MDSCIDRRQFTLIAFDPNKNDLAIQIVNQEGGSSHNNVIFLPVEGVWAVIIIDYRRGRQEELKIQNN